MASVGHRDGVMEMWIRALVLGLIVLGLFMGNQVVQTQAATLDGDVASALHRAPQGVKINGYFETGTSANNSAKVVDPGRGDGTEAVQLTDGGHNELGTIWTKDAAKMDLSLDQTASMWLYTGNKGTQSGDGMAFVLQNGGLDASAVDTSDSSHPVPAVGETLGVWGYDANNKFSRSKDASGLAKTGIQHSWALEFDTFSNSAIPRSDEDTVAKNNQIWHDYFFDNAHAANQFDIGVPGMHIASAYPGDSGSYKVFVQDFSWETWSGLWFVHHTAHYPYTKLQHQGILSLKKNSYKLLGTGQWQHLTLSWDAAASSMKYTFDDKDPDSGASRKGQSATVTIDKSKLGLTTTGSQKVRWGFTGTTGDDTGNAESNLVIFEQVPSLVSANVTAGLKDLTKNKAVAPTDDVVNAGDRLQLDYHLSYTNGREPWEKIQADLNLPKNVMFNSAKITYANGQSQDITDLTNANRTGKLSQQLSQSLSVDNLTATISLSGVAVGSGQDKVAIPATTSSFTGTNAIAQANLNGFQVAKNDETVMTMTLTGEKNIESGGTRGQVSLKEPQDVVVTGNIVYSGTNVVEDKTLTLHPELNGTAIQTQVVNNNGQFTYRLPANLILSGRDNTLKLYATDRYGHSTNDVVYQISLAAGFRELAVSPKASFNSDNPIAMKGTAMTIQPDSNWHVTVNDTKGKGDHWVLAASATPFVSKAKQYPEDRQLLSAYLAYQMADGAVQNLQQGTTDVYAHEATSDRDVVNIATSWGKQQGLLLKVGSDAIQGAYYSKITWTLKDVP